MSYETNFNPDHQNGTRLVFLTLNITTNNKVRELYFLVFLEASALQNLVVNFYLVEFEKETSLWFGHQP